MTKKELAELLEKLGFKLIGSRFLKTNTETSDYDYAITDEEVYKRTLLLLKESGKLKYRQKDVYKDEYSGSICVGQKKVGTADILSLPITSDGAQFDLHCVEKILPKNKQMLLHLEKHGI